MSTSLLPQGSPSLGHRAIWGQSFSWSRLVNLWNMMRSTSRAEQGCSDSPDAVEGVRCPADSACPRVSNECLLHGRRKPLAIAEFDAR